MSFSYLNNLNTNQYLRSNTSFRAQSSPVLNLEDSIDKLAKKVDEEKKKKHTKRAIAVGSSVLGVSLLVTVLNPRVSSKLIEKLKIAHLKSNAKIEKSKDDLIKSKFYKALSAAASWVGKFVSWTNNYNSVKDTYYKMLCTEEKSFFKIHNIEKRKKFIKFDKLFRKIMKPQHETLTKWGDALAKKTVRKSYESASKKMDSLEQLIQDFSNKLPENKQNEIQSLLRTIKTKREFFAENNINKRLSEQEKLMENLNTDIRNRWNDYSHGFIDKNIANGEHFNQNLSFWAQDMMKPERERLEKEGTKAIDELIGNSEGVQGDYNKILALISDNLSLEEKTILEKTFKKSEKALRKAEKKEFCEYFDKKRDLTLGSAPTDILTAFVGLTVGGAALASANNKDDRLTRLFTAIIPTIAGIGTNIALTSMLFSGVKGMLIGTAAGGIISLTGSRLDKHRLALKSKLNGEIPENKEVIR